MPRRICQTALSGAVTATVALRKLSDDTVLYEGTHTGETTFIMRDGDFVSAKIAHLRQVCDDLAIRVVDACVSNAWSADL